MSNATSRKQAKSLEAFQQALGLHQAGQLDEALKAYQRAIALTPDHPQLHEARGIALAQLGRNEDGLKSLNRAVALLRDSAGIYTNRGNVLNELGRPGEALADFDRALALQPDMAAAHNGRGMALTTLSQIDEALASFDRAIALGATTAEVFFNRGIALCPLRRLHDAISDFERALAMAPDQLKYRIGAAPAYAEAGFVERALEIIDGGLAIDPGSVDVHIARGNLLKALDRDVESAEAFDRALSIDPANVAVMLESKLVRQSISDWSALTDPPADMIAMIERSDKAPSPFAAVALYDDPALHKVVAERMTRVVQPASAMPPATRHDRIRIGYASADFHNHATMHLMAEVLERHDRDRFEVIALSLDPSPPDAWSERAKAATDRHVDIVKLSDRDVRTLAREMEIDIAVDLKGFTENGRPSLFSARIAPIQVNFLGFPGTMGPAMDYIVGDPWVIPQDAVAHYWEKVLWLPDSYQPNCLSRAIASTPLRRADAGLPDQGFVYCCFNQNYKIQPYVFDRWMAALRAVEHSVIWLWVENAAAQDNLRREAAARGVDPTRLIFAARVPVEDHLNRLRLADLVLDTLPYNAHTTASDALRMGVPIVTCPGRSFASRVCASILSAVGMPELITDSLDAYEALAIAIGSDSARHARIKADLAARAPGSALFDSGRFTRNLETGFATIYDRYLAGLAPDHIRI